MNASTIHVLLVAADSVDATLIRDNLAEAQLIGCNLPRFEVEHVMRRGAGMKYLDEGWADVVLIDLEHLDREDGGAVAKLYYRLSELPLVVLRARDDETITYESVPTEIQEYIQSCIYKDEIMGSLLARTLVYAIERKRTNVQLEQCVIERTINLQAQIAESQLGKQEFRSHESELSDIINAEAIQALMDDFYALTDIGIAIVDMEGGVLVATGWQDICTKFHRVHPETCRHCIESDTLLSSGVKPGTYRLYRCKNRMWDMATPIIVGSRHVGNLFLGQFFFADEEVDREVFRQQARRYGFDEEAYLAALDRVPRWSRERVETVFRFYTRFATMISQLGHS
ncbi:MAG: PocR ligand-binding domain-containing protein, partial [Anaerolineae bacterium]